MTECLWKKSTHSEQTKSYNTDADGVVHSKNAVRGYAEGSSNMNVVSGKGVLPNKIIGMTDVQANREDHWYCEFSEGSLLRRCVGR